MHPHCPPPPPLGLSSREIASCDLTAAVSEVLEPSGGPIALRMAAHLVFGISVIYSRKTELLYKDSVSFFKDLGDARWRRASNVDLDDGGNKENSKQVCPSKQGVVRLFIECMLVVRPSVSQG